MPHVCGDEPPAIRCAPMVCGVCPTYVGMNPRRVAFFTIPYRMPHVCGDEPSMDNHIATFRLYAPRMWG